MNKPRPPEAEMFAMLAEVSATTGYYPSLPAARKHGYNGSEAWFYYCQKKWVKGKELRRIQVPQALSMGIKKFGDGLFAIAIDGAMYRINE